jgi:CBS domain-containing protein
MREKGYRHIPITERDKVIGIVSDRDLNTIIATRKDKGPEDIYLSELCLFEPYVVDESTLLSETLDTMISKKYGSVVVTSNGKCSGIFTTIDACRLLRSLLPND